VSRGDATRHKVWFEIICIINAAIAEKRPAKPAS